jgi:uncharacterized protein YggE
MLVAFIQADDAAAQSNEVMPKMRTVTATGSGRLLLPPDMATLTFSVVTRDESPEVARSANAEASRLALDSIRELGVEETDIRLEHLSLNPVREWDPETRKHIDRGFEVSRSVVVTLKDLDLVPTVVANVVQKGANRIGNIRYGLSTRQEHEREALSLAVADARARAATMVEGLDESVGRPVQVSEEIADRPVPVYRAEAMLAYDKGAEPTPEAYAPGEIEVRARVVVVFEIE